MYERVFPTESHLQDRYPDGFMVWRVDYNSMYGVYTYKVVARNQDTLVLAEHLLTSDPHE